jgi:hypothetical protein
MGPGIVLNAGPTVPPPVAGGGVGGGGGVESPTNIPAIKRPIPRRSPNTETPIPPADLLAPAIKRTIKHSPAITPHYRRSV